MKLYNTASSQVEDLIPQRPPEVTIYTCGPTVYDYPHIGNWFTFIRYDLLVRTLLANGYQPNWVMNITDVGHLVSDADDGEDKLSKGAKREGKTAWEVAEFYSAYFINSLKKLNFINPNYLPKATDHIKEQIDFIAALELKGFTYQTSDGIYYDTSKFPAYTSFAKLDLNEQQTATRIEVNQEKRQAADFALWKFSPKQEQRDMEWDSPWGKGFPGWHLECSAMSLKYLGATVDIHSGGIDHIPIHHTNEIAQSVAITGQPLAHIWMHTNHILINDTKISKSLDNTISLEDIEKRGYSLEAFRLLVMESHYRNQSKFSWESLAAAQARLMRYRSFAALRYQLPETNQGLGVPAMLECLNNDLNAPQALLCLEEYLTASELQPPNPNNIKTIIDLVDNLFGLKLNEVKDITKESKDLISKREQARKEKDWQQADTIRKKLTELNITVNDKVTGPEWYYLN